MSDLKVATALCVVAIGIVSLPLLGWAADPQPPFSLHVEATQEAIVVTVTDTSATSKELPPLKELGRCSMQLWVTADGYIRVAQILKTSGHSRLDEACLRGVAGNKMLPARDDKGPINSWIEFPVIWKARMNREPLASDRVGMAIATLVPDQSLAVDMAGYPKNALQRREHGDVFLNVLVSDSGLARVVSIRESSGSRELDDAAVAAIRAARFNPALSGKKAVDSSNVVVVSWRLPGDNARAPFKD